MRYRLGETAVFGVGVLSPGGTAPSNPDAATWWIADGSGVEVASGSYAESDDTGALIGSQALTAGEGFAASTGYVLFSSVTIGSVSYLDSRDLYIEATLATDAATIAAACASAVWSTVVDVLTASQVLRRLLAVIAGTATVTSGDDDETVVYARQDGSTPDATHTIEHDGSGRAVS